MSVVSTINNTENYGEHRSWIDVDGGRMATVFVILLIVIYLSKYLITVVNKVAPRRDPPKKSTSL